MRFSSLASAALLLGGFAAAEPELDERTLFKLTPPPPPAAPSASTASAASAPAPSAPAASAPGKTINGINELPASLSALIFPSPPPAQPFPSAAGIPLGVNKLSQSAQNGPSLLGSITDLLKLPNVLDGFQFPGLQSGYGTPPFTGQTRRYNFNIARGTLAPDGVPLEMLLVNGQFPGPMIEANWGDWIEVTITNSIAAPQEGFSMHWHGILHQNREFEDGTPGISQCPIAPGKTFTYRFRADVYGTSWYHSHYSAQYAGGAFGPLIIHGPNHVQYDQDLGPIMINDWYHTPYDQIVANVMGTDFSKVIPVSDNNLINGKNNYDCSLAPNPSTCTANAGLSKFNFQSGKSYRLRLINSGSDALQRFSIDGHNLSVIAYDFVPIKPYTTNVVTLGIGQRADVIVQANGNATGAYWMRSDMSQLCSITRQPSARAIIYYNNANQTSTPTTTAWPIDDSSCGNDALSKTVPYFSQTPGKVAANAIRNITLSFTINATGHFLWTMDGSSYRTNFNDPLLQKWTSRQPPTNYTGLNLYDFGANSSYQIVIQNLTPAPHPMHIHGHNFYVLNEGIGTWDGSIVNPSNPMRRDVQMLQPNGGYIALQVDANNPGVWPFHCHIAWHVSAGLYVNLLERPKDIPNYVQVPPEVNQVCTDWNTWSKSNVVGQIDSGLRMMEKNRKRHSHLRRHLDLAGKHAENMGSFV